MRYKNISVIISSHLTDDENKKNVQHIKKSSGIQNIEILTYKNFNEYSLTEVYNIGLNESRNEIVVFVHNDVEFNTNNWGKILLNKFNTSDFGILGVAGTTDIGNDGTWWSDRNKMIGIVNHRHNNKKWESKYSNNYGKEIVEVCAIDGLFIAVNKNVIQRDFNELFTGYHYYDIPFCIDNYLNGVKIGVIFDIRLTHMSIGQTNDQWEKNRFKFTAKYDKNLPISLKVDNIKDLINKNIIVKKQPLLSIIIPHKSNNELLFNLIESIYEKTTYSNFNIYIADTGSELCEIYNLENFIKKYENIFLIKYNYYNFASINNDVVKKHISKDTELIMFLNNDVLFVNDIISQMVDTYNKNIYTCGTIGCRLYYEDNTIQHSSIAIYKIKEKYRITHYGLKSYYKYLNDINYDVFGNTAACMMTPYKLFLNIGMFDESYSECFEDVQYNIDCILNQKKNIFVGSAVGYHLESQTRNIDINKNKRMSIDYSKLVKYIESKSDIISKFVNKLN